MGWDIFCREDYFGLPIISVRVNSIYGLHNEQESTKLVFAAAAKSLQLCPTVLLHRRQPTRLPRPWDSPGKNTGVGCHFLLQCMKMKSESEVAQSCPTCKDPMDYSLPGLVIPYIKARGVERT